MLVFLAINIIFHNFVYFLVKKKITEICIWISMRLYTKQFECFVMTMITQLRKIWKISGNMGFPLVWCYRETQGLSPLNLVKYLSCNILPWLYLKVGQVSRPNDLGIKRYIRKYTHLMCWYSSCHNFQSWWNGFKK